MIVKYSSSFVVLRPVGNICFAFILHWRKMSTRRGEVNCVFDATDLGFIFRRIYVHILCNYKDNKTRTVGTEDKTNNAYASVTDEINITNTL